MKNLKFVVRLNHDDSGAPEYVRRIDRIPVLMTSNRKLALVMGRFTAEDVVKSLHTSRRGSGVVSVKASPTAVLNLNRDERDWVLCEATEIPPCNTKIAPVSKRGERYHGLCKMPRS